MDDRDCQECQELLVLLGPRGLGHWLRCPTTLGSHGYISRRAVDRLTKQPSVPDQVNQRIEESDAAGQVPWLDLNDRGEWQVWTVNHGEIPNQVTR
jgi:hypothetical protein